MNCKQFWLLLVVLGAFFCSTNSLTVYEPTVGEVEDALKSMAGSREDYADMIYGGRSDISDIGFDDRFDEDQEFQEREDEALEDVQFREDASRPEYLERGDEYAYLHQ